MTKSPATYWNAGRFIGVMSGVDVRSQTVDETMLPRRRANKSQPSRSDIFPQATSYRFCWGLVTWQGSKWSWARPKARRGGAGR